MFESPAQGCHPVCWVIEEFFKAVKTGCSYEERQFDSAHALLNMLAVTLPLAVALLCLRHATRAAPDAPAKRFVPHSELDVLRALLDTRGGRTRLGVAPSVREVWMGIAALGGHVRHNGEPGWLVVYRGYADLRAAIVVWEAALAFARTQADVEPTPTS